MEQLLDGLVTRLVRTSLGTGLLLDVKFQWPKREKSVPVFQPVPVVGFAPVENEGVPRGKMLDLLVLSLYVL